MEYGLNAEDAEAVALAVKEAAAAAHVNEFADGLPHGMDTLSGTAATVWKRVGRLV